MRIPLEDTFADILGKAQRGLCLSDTALSSKTGVDVETIQRLRAGDFDAAAAGLVAPALGLSATALVALGEKAWEPHPIGSFNRLAQFNSPFDDITVNSYLVWDETAGLAVAFDTGSDCGPMLELLEKRRLKLKWILLTHTHGDHVFDLDRLREKTGAPVFVSRREPLEGAAEIEEGTEFEAGDLCIRARLTWGHSRGGLTYVIEGLARPVAVVGDSLFAGSMGGGTVSYPDALRNNRDKILTLPDDTIICPGHGPMTSVGEEKEHNPFFSK